MPKHIDINFRASDGHWQFAKAWFPNDSFNGKSGTTYRLGAYVNKGSNGTLFRCFDPVGRPFAVKFLHQLDDQRLARFEFESLVLSDMEHANVLGVVDAGEIETTHSVDVPFLVTELFSGNLEFHVRNNGPLQPAEVLRYAFGLCDALAYIHEKGVIHRDIKPANIFISAVSGAVLGDFGIAKTATDAGTERYYRSDMTMVSEFVGPVLWLSPELAAYSRDKKQAVDHRSDLFQVGLVVWYLLTAEIPRGGLDRADDPTGGKFIDLVQKLTKQSPDRRYQSAKETKTALQAVRL
jgi:serine/threonine protein kinase